MVTVLLMNYKREENLPKIIDALKSQTVDCKIFLWNNADKPYHDDSLDLVINSSRNLKCWARWSMIAYTDSPYIMTHDDDLCFKSPDVLQKLIDSLENNYEPGRAIGFTGVKLGSGKRYYPSKIEKKIRKLKIKVGPKHINFPEKDTYVDSLKGRLIFCKRSDLASTPLFVDCEDCDDIVVSSILANKKRKHHLVTSSLNGLIEELPGGKDNMALSQNDNWLDLRTSLSQKYFSK